MAVNGGILWRLPVDMDKDVDAREVFKFFDTDSSGALDRGELQAVLTRQGDDGPLTDGDIDEIMAQFDVDGNGTIDFDEFQAMWTDLGAFRTAAARVVLEDSGTLWRWPTEVSGAMDAHEAFKFFDTDGSGALDRDELKAVLTGTGAAPLTDATIDGIMAEFDADGNGGAWSEGPSPARSCDSWLHLVVTPCRSQGLGVAAFSTAVS